MKKLGTESNLIFWNGKFNKCKRIKWKIIFLISIATSGYSQQATLIDQQVLEPGKTVQLVSFPTGNENTHYALQYINLFTKDTLTNYMREVQHAHCSPPNSIFFINDSVGFFTESGGCYASYNQLFRTSNRGLSWQFIESGSRIDGNFYSRLNNETFYMFNESQGIIIWHVNEENQLMYCLTNDGGITWNQHNISMEKFDGSDEIQNIYYSKNGQVTIVMSSAFIFESDRENVVILQSNNFGKSFKELR